MVPFQIFLCVVAVVFGFWALPQILTFLRIYNGFNKRKAERIVEEATRIKIEKMRKSPQFRSKIEEILKLIEQDAALNKNELEIAYVDTCAFDVEIKNELEARGFETHAKYDHMLKITW